MDFLVTPTAMALGQGALTLYQGMQGYQAQKQDYLNQVAQQKASDEFAAWTASNQARTQDLNNSYAYWQQQINYGQELNYSAQVRNFELSKSIQQAETVFRTRASAGADYAQASAALNDAFAQQSMADAVSMMQYKQQALRSAASAEASMNEGMNVDRYLNDYARQMGDMQAMQSLNQQFRERQLTREQAGQVAQYLNRYNSQQLYEAQQVNDPIAPFAPLPTLVNPAGPSFTGAAPSASTAFIGSALNATVAGLNTYGSLKKYTNSGKPEGQT
ncbi:MAG: hypothetical protein ACPGPH_03485 [Synechococcus sp.]